MGHRQSTRPHRKSRIARLLSATGLIAALVAGFFFVNGETSQRAEALTTTIGLVNEDLAAEFNGTEYTFGANFVDRISQDSEYNWTILSRSVAEKAYTDGSLDAVIYLPQSFSHDILTLQELDPTKATVEYKLEHQPSAQADRILNDKIVSVVSGFNQGVVKMYYASLADNIAGADGHMRNSLTNQEALISAFTSDVQEPFSTTMPDFKTFIEYTKSLKDVNASTVEAQNSFTKSVTEQLSQAGESFSGKLPEIDEYTKRQQEIAQVNAANSNKGITDQAASDHDFYGTQFDAMRTSTLCRLTGLDAAGDAAACQNPDASAPAPLQTQLSDLRTAITAYTGPMSAMQVTVGDIRGDLDVRISNLERLMDELNPLDDPTDPESPRTPAYSLNPLLLTNLQDDIDALKNARQSIDDNPLPAPAAPTDLDTRMTDLGSWQTAAAQGLKDAELTASTVKTLKVKGWTGSSADNTDVYIDSSDGLQNSLTDLITRSAEASGKIGESELTIPDNSKQFDSLLKSASTTYDGANLVLGGANELLTTGSTALDENQQYYSNFATVLANTRTQGVDTGKINDFMSAPIDAINITPARPIVADSFDPKWIIIFAGGLLAGVLVMTLGRTFRRGNRA